MIWTSKYRRVLALTYAADMIAVVFVADWLIGRTRIDANLSQLAALFWAWMSEPVVLALSAVGAGFAAVLDVLAMMLPIAGM